MIGLIARVSKFWKNTHSAIKVGIIAIGSFTLVWLVCTLIGAPKWLHFLFYGTTAMIVAALIGPLTDDLKSKSAKIYKAVAVACLAAAVGLLSTWGWDARSNYYNDREMLVAVVTEIQTNTKYLQYNNKLGAELNRSSKIHIAAGFLCFQNDEARRSMMQNVIARTDKDLIRLLNKYVSVVELANAVVTRSNRELSVAPTCLTVDVAKLMVKKAVNSTEVQLSKVQASLNELKSLIEGNYKWAIERVEDIGFRNVLKEALDPNAGN